MFTGIVERTGRIVSTRPGPGGKVLRIDAGPLADGCKLGDSVSVTGVCLTVTQCDRETLSFDVVAETLRRTTLGNKQSGDRVNLERSLRVGDRLDGHFVQGHIDGAATVSRVDPSPSDHLVWFDADDAFQPYLIPKGAIAIDGVSLTIAEVLDHAFSVALIPTTLERTTLSDLKPGGRVNLESDILARTIVHHLGATTASPGLSWDGLRKAGFA